MGGSHRKGVARQEDVVGVELTRSSPLGKVAVGSHLHFSKAIIENIFHAEGARHVTAKVRIHVIISLLLTHIFGELWTVRGI